MLVRLYSRPPLWILSLVQPEIEWWQSLKVGRGQIKTESKRKWNCQDWDWKPINHQNQSFLSLYSSTELTRIFRIVLDKKENRAFLARPKPKTETITHIKSQGDKSQTSLNQYRKFLDLSITAILIMMSLSFFNSALFNFILF